MTDRDADDAEGVQEAPDGPWLTPEQLREWKSLVAMLMTLPAALDAQLRRDAGINIFEYHVLAALSAAPGHRLPMVELAALSQGSMSRLSHAASRLEDAGWIERRACNDAGRRTEAHLTAAGWRKLEQVAPGHVHEARRLVVDALSPEQLTALGAAARTVVAAADPGIARRLSTT